MLVAVVLATAAFAVLAVHPAFSSPFVPKRVALGVGAAALLVAAAVQLARGGPGALGRSPLDVPAGTWLALNLASVAWAGNRALGVRAVAAEAALVVLGLAAARAAGGAGRIRLAAGLGALGVAASAVALVQLAGFDPIGAVPLSTLEESDRASLYRAISTIGHKNLAAGLGAASAPVLLAVGLASASRLARSAAFAGMAVCLAAVLLLVSRGAWVALGVAGAVPWLLPRLARAVSGKVGRSALGAAAAIVALAAVLVGTAPGRGRGAGAEAGGSFTTRGTAAFAEGRPALWWSALHVAAEAPLLGVGAGQFALRQPAAELALVKAAGDRDRGGVVTHRAHSDPLEVAAELGPVGLAAFLWLWWGAILAAGRRLGSDADRALRLLTLGGAAAVVGVGVHALGDFPLGSPANAAWAWITLGGLVAGMAPGGAASGGGPTSGARPVPAGTSRGARWAPAGLLAVCAVPVAGLPLFDARVDQLSRRGAALLDAGRDDEAERELAAARALNPRDGATLYHLGRLAVRRGDPAGAASSFAESLGWNDHHVARRDLGLALAASDRHAEARAALEDVVWLHPGSSPRPFLVLGALRLEVGDRAGALDAFVRCRCPDGDYYAGELAREDGDLPQAVWRYRQAGTDRARARLRELGEEE